MKKTDSFALESTKAKNEKLPGANCCLEANSIELRFGDLRVLDNVSFELPSGDTFVILGESGCGKTSLLRVLAGLHSEYSGSVRVEGTILDRRPGPYPGIVYMDQDAVMFDHLDLFENIAFALRIARLPNSEVKQRVDEILEAVELTVHSKKRSWELSGGQKQRVAFARAILSKPRVLLLDEPFCSLDGRNRRSMQELFMSLSRQYHISSVFVTHDLKEALIVGNRFACMADGKLRVFGSRQDFIQDDTTGIPSERLFWRNAE